MHSKATARDELVERLRKATAVNDMFTGDTASSAFEAGSPLWPGSAAWASVQPFMTTSSGPRRLQEYRYIPADGSRESLPVAFMFEDQPDGHAYVRVYSDHHLVEDRAPILPVVEDIHPWRDESDVLYAYFSALNGNRLEEVLDVFDEDGYFRHSNGEIFIGRERLKQDFTKMMGSTGIRIGYCRFTDDGKVCAAEAYMPSGRPAVAVYERSAVPGRLRAVRIYL
jgi:hypothetical protein